MPQGRAGVAEALSPTSPTTVRGDQRPLMRAGRKAGEEDAAEDPLPRPSHVARACSLSSRVLQDIPSAAPLLPVPRAQPGPGDGLHGLRVPGQLRALAHRPALGLLHP